jgi:hypothetical protein
VSRALRLALLLAAALAPAGAAAQEPAPLAPFVAEVARRWAEADADAVVALAAPGGRILLDLGSGGAGEVQPRNAAAALRRLFAGRETTGVRSTGATVAGGRPVRGFGELAWTSRPRGVREARTATVYVGAVWEGGAWRVRELRVLR